MSRLPTDLRALGARQLPTRALVAQLLGPRADDADVDVAAAALSLHHRARDAALLQLNGGPRLLAAVELGRRAWMHPPPLGARVAGPVDVVAVAGPRLVDEEGALVVALDVRGRVAALAASSDEAGVLQAILMAGCRRGVVVKRVDHAAVPEASDVEFAVSVRDRGSFVGVDVVDSVVVGDDGFCSLLRLGLLGPPRDRRYG